MNRADLLIGPEVDCNTTRPTIPGKPRVARPHRGHELHNQVVLEVAGSGARGCMIAIVDDGEKLHIEVYRGGSDVTVEKTS
jgi:hypothetical protein